MEEHKAEKREHDIKMQTHCDFSRPTRNLGERWFAAPNRNLWTACRRHEEQGVRATTTATTNNNQR